jgi:hypothetical protein
VLFLELDLVALFSPVKKAEVVCWQMMNENGQRQKADPPLGDDKQEKQMTKTGKAKADDCEV